MELLYYYGDGILVNVLMAGTTKSALNGQWIAHKSPLTSWIGLIIWWWYNMMSLIYFGGGDGILVNVLMEGATKSALNGQWTARKSPLTSWNGLLIWWWVSGHGTSLLLW